MRSHSRKQHLTEALIGMEKVAEHINEMQRIHEEYGAIFDHLFRQHHKASKQVGCLYYSIVEARNNTAGSSATVNISKNGAVVVEFRREVLVLSTLALLPSG